MQCSADLSAITPDCDPTRQQTKQTLLKFSYFQSKCFYQTVKVLTDSAQMCVVGHG